MVVGLLNEILATEEKILHTLGVIQSDNEKIAIGLEAARNEFKEEIKKSLTSTPMSGNWEMQSKVDQILEHVKKLFHIFLLLIYF